MPCKLLSDIGADELIFLNSLKHIKLIRSTNNILVLVNNAANILDKEKLVCVIQQDSKYWAPGTTADDYKNFTICKTNILTFFIAANQLKKYESKCITSKGPLTDSRATKIGECYTLTNDLCMGEAYYIIRNSEIYPKYKFVCIFTRSSEIMAYFSDQLYTPPYYLQALIIKNDLPLTFSTMRKSINFIS
ncbi:MAG: hypothetical protein Hyperionvirus31_20 [Hyperionvirus sp.]|uniref:Uncharacterized protein n=1 Tax=Hyperionvirus sp. TaxID=2487770 RepID=A0A3G5ABQ9_9VIRU|nr:MAG: hypothetical protein Hyperionvirus31_20 [Hyperionvirus sp.]